MNKYYIAQNCKRAKNIQKDNLPWPLLGKDRILYSPFDKMIFEGILKQ